MKAVYLYGLGRPGAAARASLGADPVGDIEPGVGLRGLLVADGLEAVVCDVPQELFVGPEAEARLADVRWLAPRAAAHERVLRLMSEGPEPITGGVAPARLGTLFRDDGAVRAALAPRAAALRRLLESTTGRSEYTLRAWLGAPAEPAPEHAAAAGGADYLRRRRERHAQAARVFAPGPAEFESAQRAARRLVDGADRAELRPARLPERCDEAGRACVGAWAVLAEPADADRAAERMDADAGFHWTLTGPWPVYSFCPFLADAEAVNP